MTSEHTGNNEQSRSNVEKGCSKKAYRAPQLVQFGTVRQLALAGTSGFLENTNNMMDMDNLRRI